MSAIDLFLDRKNMTRWTLDAPQATLPINDYYKVLSPTYSLMFEEVGYNAPRGIRNQIAIYSSGGQYVAQVASIVEPSGGTVVRRTFGPAISVATYTEYRGDVIILNRFDAKGYPHQNNYQFYGKNKDLYEKYFTDYYSTQTKRGVTVQQPCAYTPHFHFNTREQTINLGNQDRANAISIDGLILYLMDLKKCQDASDPLLNDSLGMPFLGYAQNRTHYNSQLLVLLNDIVNSTSTSHADESVKKFMESLINRMTRSQRQTIENVNGMRALFATNLDKILFDFKLLKKIIVKFEDYDEFILKCASAVMSSVSGVTMEGENRYEY